MKIEFIYQASKSIIQSILVIVCVVHICSIVYFKANPVLPDIMKYKKNIEDIDFPISFIICINSKNKGIEKMNKNGYLDEWYFFSGESRINDSIIGWAGHSENGPIYETAEGRQNLIFQYLKILNSELLKDVSYDWSSIVANISLISNLDKDKSISGKAIKWSLVPLFPNCQSIDLLDYFEINSPFLVLFFFHEFQDMGISLYIQERNRAVKRTLQSNLMAYSGPQVKINDMSVGQEIRVMIKISQEIDSEKDVRAKCKIYPNKIYENFNECDEDFVFHEVNKILNITPFWSTKDLKSVTKNRKVEQKI